MKKILFASMTLLASVALTSCDQDFNEGLAGPLTSPAETPQTVAFGNGAITTVPTINMANVEGESVKVCAITAPTVTDESAEAPTYTITIDDVVYELTTNGEMLVADLEKILDEKFDKHPVERTLEGVVKAYVNVNGQSIVTTSDVFSIVAIPNAPEIESAYYFTGTLNGWDNGNTDYELSNGGLDPYENPVFTMRIPAPEDGSDIEFKMTPASKIGTGDWSKCLASDGEGKFAYNNGGNGGNLKITAVEGAAFYKVTFNMLELTYTATAGFATPETWYLVGSCIGDGSWSNSSFDNVGTSLFPLARVSGTTISYTGYFTTDGFKLIKDPGSWNDQWGQGANGYVKNDGGSGNITVPAAGYYTVTLNTMTDELTIVPADITPATYEVGMAGSFNGWSFEAMTRCPGSEHMWKAEMVANNAEEAKFLIDGWSVNWGAAEFPSGIGEQNGPNIPVEKGTYIIIFNDITGGYNFIRTDAPEEPVSKPDTWYLVGSCIGDGSWGNAPENIGTALFPLAYIGESNISYTGYFTTDGFKLIKTPGSWDDQWGQGASGYVKNDGGSGNITVPAAGYYTVTLNTATDELTIEPADITPATYEVGMAGSFNGWSFEAMTRCPGSEHMWKADMVANNAEEAKFLIDGWSVNWGAAEFPSGIGEQNGPNIPVEEGNYIVIFNDITGGYNFIKK